MFKINVLINKICLISISLMFSCQATEHTKNPGVTQVDLEQLVRKASAPNRQDSEIAKQVLEESRLQENSQLKKAAKQRVGRSGKELTKGKVQLDKGTSVTQHESTSTRCKSSLMSAPASTGEKSHSSQDLIIFVSGSMPSASLKALFRQAASLGVPLVFRGLIGNSFVKTKSFFEDQEINGEVDPTLFETYKVSEVPTFVLRQGQSFDRVQGNISLPEALTLFKTRGDLKQQADKLLTSMKASHS